MYVYGGKLQFHPFKIKTKCTKRAFSKPAVQSFYLGNFMHISWMILTTFY